jgi:GT2 family glycosyltransferase
MDANPGRQPRLSVSIVSYGRDVGLLPASVDALAQAAAAVGPVQLLLVDNGPPDPARSAVIETLVARWPWDAERLSGHGNIGYGRGHNLAIQRCHAPLHLVMNPDVEAAPDALAEALAFLTAHPECGLLAPAVRSPEGELQYLCKRRPAVIDLLLRGFGPRLLQVRFKARLDRYEMRDLIDAGGVVWDPPLVSGCFMLFRRRVLEAIAGFDPGYFLYFEDFDLSLRAARVGRIAYVPTVRIVHYGGKAARKGLAHQWMFSRSAARYFRRHGWRWL